MQQSDGLTIPQSLAEICHPAHLAVLVYDMQDGILSQLPQETAAQVRANVAEVLTAARAGGYRVFFSRHLSLPREAMGVFQLRQAMAWQRVETPQAVKPWFLRGSPAIEIASDLAPLPSEVVFDKITMSAFEGTFLDIALRDCGIKAFAVVGVALEIGIEPTVRHGTDLAYIPVVVADACGGRDEAAQARTLEGFRFAGDALITETKTICDLLRSASDAKK